MADTRIDEPRADPTKPRCPSWLPDRAKRVWRRLIPRLERMGILSRCDRNALVRYCHTQGMWEDTVEWLVAHGTVFPDKDVSGRVIALKEYPQVATMIKLGEQLLRLERQFGLTPSARAELAITKENPLENRGTDRFFKRGGWADLQ